MTEQNFQTSDPSIDKAPVEAAPAETALMKTEVTTETPAIPKAEPSTVLLDKELAKHLQDRWNEIQGKFVDDPHAAVQEADLLIAEVAETIAKFFANERIALSSRWNQETKTSTEDLRKILQYYHSLFNRLVAK